LIYCYSIYIIIQCIKSYLARFAFKAFICKLQLFHGKDIIDAVKRKDPLSGCRGIRRFHDEENAYLIRFVDLLLEPGERHGAVVSLLPGSRANRSELQQNGNGTVKQIARVNSTRKRKEKEERERERERTLER